MQTGMAAKRIHTDRNPSGCTGWYGLNLLWAYRCSAVTYLFSSLSVAGQSAFVIGVKIAAFAEILFQCSTRTV